MVKYLVLTIALLVSSVSYGAERHVYYFNMEGCQWCPIAQNVLQEEDVKNLILEYNDNFIIDIKKNPDWRNYYKIKSVPALLIVDVDGKDRKILYRWQLDSTKDKGKSILKSALQRFSPERQKPTYYKVPFLRKLTDAILP